MKKDIKKLNKKGFTLIELLAVIVILAILVTISVPAVTKKLAEARRDTYVTNAKRAIEALKNEVIVNGIKGSNVTVTYGTPVSLSNIEKLLESGNFNKSSFGQGYESTSGVIVCSNGTYYVCMVDTAGNGFNGWIAETALDPTSSVTTGLTSASCPTTFTCPA